MSANVVVITERPTGSRVSLVRHTLGARRAAQRSERPKAEGAATDRLLIMRTGIVDHGTPAFDRLVHITKCQRPWWAHQRRQTVDQLDSRRRLPARCAFHPRWRRFHLGSSTSPPRTGPQNRDMMTALPRALTDRSHCRHRNHPSTLGALRMRTDPALALTGRRCVSTRLLDAGFEFHHPKFDSAFPSLLVRG